MECDWLDVFLTVNLSQFAYYCHGMPPIEHFEYSARRTTAEPEAPNLFKKNPAHTAHVRKIIPFIIIENLLTR